MTYRNLCPISLKKQFSYDPDTGAVRDHTGRVGKPCFNGRYRSIYLQGFSVMEHTLAWALMTGSWPEKTIDHINRDGKDNRWCNLRLATPGQQQANKRSWGLSGIKGVRWDRGKWVAEVRVNRKTVNLGRFETKEAAAAVAKREREAIWGEFAT